MSLVIVTRDIKFLKEAKEVENTSNRKKAKFLSFYKNPFQFYAKIKFDMLN
jgi:hypothetical protein